MEVNSGVSSLVRSGLDLGHHWWFLVVTGSISSSSLPSSIISNLSQHFLACLSILLFMASSFNASWRGSIAVPGRLLVAHSIALFWIFCMFNFCVFDMVCRGTGGYSRIGLIKAL